MAKRKEKPGLLIRADGTIKAVRVDISKDLEELYELTRSKVVQMVEVPNSRFKIWLDEEGKLDGRPINAIATHLWGYAGDHIVGDVVVLT